jgi:plasmid stabilization system protein ParE
MKSIVIKWNKKAVEQFDAAIAFIEEDSITSAKKVSKEILERIDRLATYPEIYPPDKYKINNDSSFRAFEIHHYRISYRFKENEIRIIRIRHTSMNPLNY